MRNPNGFGTVYKLPGKRRRPWVARVTTGWDIITDEAGREKTKQNYQIIGYFEDKPSAITALGLHRLNPVSKKANITLEEIYKEWSEGKYQYISKPTADCYRAGWMHLSKFGKVVFKELRTAHIQTVIDGCHKAGKSRSTIEKIKVVAGQLYDYAMQNDIVSKDYSEFVNLPKSEKEEKSIFTDLEIQKLEKATGAVPWADTVMILIHTGMRISEMLNLTKFNIDMGSQTITGGIKTDAGKNRVIPIHLKIMPHIKKWYDRNGEALICKEQGKKMSDDYYRKYCYYPTLKSLEIRPLNPHCCRHTFASILRKRGVDTKAIQLLMGHAQYAFTADVYTHTDMEELSKAVAQI